MPRQPRLPTLPTLLVAALALAPAHSLGAGPAAPGPPVVHGLVRDGSGAALPGAQVELLPLLGNHPWARGVLDGRAAPEPVAQTRTGETGRFTFQAPGPGLWSVVVHAEGLVPMRYRLLPLVEDTELPPVALLADVGARVGVRDAHGRPAAGIWIYALSASESLWREAASEGWQVAARLGRAGEDGRLHLPRATGERLEVYAFPAGSLASTQASGTEEVTLTLEPTGSSRWLVEVREPAPPRVASDTAEPEEPAAGPGPPAADVVAAVGRLTWPIGRTGADGRLALGGMLTRPTELYLFAPDGRRLRLELPPGTGTEPLRLTLPPPDRVRGRVLDATRRRPLPGALVWPLHDPGTFIATDARGGWELIDATGDSFPIRVLAPSFLAQTARIPGGIAAARQAPTLALEAAAARRGWVVDPLGRPLAEVSLAAVPSLGDRPPRSPAPAATVHAASNAEGGFLLRGLDPGSAYQVTAVRSGFTEAKLQLVASGPGGPSEALRIVLSPARAGAGQVVDGEDRPLAGAEVTVTAGDATRRAVTGEGGRFEIPELPGSRVDLSARKQGFFPVSVRGVQIEPGEGTADLGALVLRHGTAIPGRVLDRAGTPLPEVEVRVVEDDGRPLRVVIQEAGDDEPDATTDARGRFRVGDLEPGRRFHLLFERQGYRGARVAAVEAPPPQPLVVRLEAAAGRLAGRVVDEGGEPVPGARLRLSWALPPPGTAGLAPLPEEEPRSTASDARGGFGFTDLPPGEVELEAAAEGFQPAEPLRLAIPEKGAVEDLLLVLVHGALVEGRLSSETGEPVAGAFVRVGPGRDASDAEGRFHLAGVPPGTHLLSVRHLEYELIERKLEVQPGVNVIELVLTAGWPVAGRVVDEAEEPVPAAHLLLRSVEGRGMREYRAASGGDGRFELPRVVDGFYDVEVSHPGHAAIRQAAALQVAGGPVEDLEIRLVEGATLTGRLLGLDPGEMAGAQVEAVGDDRTSLAGRVDYAGTYEIADLGPGVWQLRAWLAGGGRQAEARVVVEPGGGRLVRDLEFGGALTLSGQVLFGGLPLPETRVALDGREVASHRTVVTDHEGRFRLEDLEPGRYRLSLAHHRESLLHNQDIDLSSDRDLVVEIATTRLSGTVRSASDERPLDDALVSLQLLLGADGSPGSLITVATGGDGTFTVARLSAGRYRLSVRRDGYTPAERLLELAAGAPGDELEISLSPTQGLELTCRLAAGPPPDRVSLHVLDAAGGLLLSETRSLAEDGYARFPTVPAGTWALVVSAPGGASAELTATVPGEALQITLAPAARLRVRVPVLIEANRVGSLRLFAPDGRPFRGQGPTGNLQDRWTLEGGAGVVEDLSAGLWILQVTAAGGQTWQTTVTLSPGQETDVTLE